MSSPRRCIQGFTLVELITVIIIIGVLAATATSTLIPSSAFQMQASRDQIVAAISAAQQRAMSRTKLVRVSCSSNQIDIKEDTDGDGDFSPSTSVYLGGVQYPLTLPPNQNLTEADITFNRMGEANAANLTLSQNGASVSIVITESGYVY